MLTYSSLTESYCVELELAPGRICLCRTAQLVQPCCPSKPVSLLTNIAIPASPSPRRLFALRIALGLVGGWVVRLLASVERSEGEGEAD